MKVREADQDFCEACSQPLADDQFRLGWDGPVCHDCEPLETHSTSDAKQ